MQMVDSAALAPGTSEGAKWGGRSGGGGGGAAIVLGKRTADESRLNDDDRFAKRLNLLSLEQNNGHANSNYYLPIAHAPPPKDKQTSDSSAAVRATNIPPPQDELMQVDDTPDRVYIHNLDEELAGIESSEGEERLIFLPDIERHFSKIPQRVLYGRSADDHSNEGQEVVLYGAPKSLTVDESHDSVRKAIIESRQRARELAALSARSDDMTRRYGEAEQLVETAHGYGGGYEADMEPDLEDVDAMDIG